MHDSGAPSVLLIDDSPEIRLLFSRFLRESGMAVTLAEDGIAALAHARAHVPDAIVCDLAMPRMDGLALCRALRSEYATRHVPLLVVSGEDPSQLRAALEAGCDAVLTKPCTGARLVSMVEHLLARARERQSDEAREWPASAGPAGASRATDDTTTTRREPGANLESDGHPLQPPDDE